MENSRMDLKLSVHKPVGGGGRGRRVQEITRLSRVDVENMQKCNIPMQKWWVRNVSLSRAHPTHQTNSPL
jgi:hypothetical protein